jgi:LPS export ABC transporter protein LptC
MENRKTEKGKKALSLFTLIPPALFALLASCSFDYGSAETKSDSLPDIVMEDVEYVRVRGGDPLVRFLAEKAMRYEEKQKMELERFSFEQFSADGRQVSAQGSAVEASVELDSGNIRMGEGVSINVSSEDIVIETKELKWEDKERVLSAGEEEEVTVQRSDGTSFLGRGFSANARSRTWSFSGGVEGSYIHQDDDEDETGKAGGGGEAAGAE